MTQESTDLFIPVIIYINYAYNTIKKISNPQK